MENGSQQPVQQPAAGLRLHRMPCLPRSSAAQRLSCMTAALVMLYGTKPGCATKPLVDATLTIAPAVSLRASPGLRCIARAACLTPNA